VRRDERLELPGDLRVPARGEVGVDALLERREPQLLQPGDLRLRERLVGQVGERRPAPQAERLAQHPRGRAGIGAAGLGDQRLEARRVELRRVEAEHVARRAGDEPAVAELAAQARDVHLDALGDRRRRRLAPDLVDQPLRRDHVVGVQEQHREQRALLGPAERERATAVGHLQRAE
jgi:hypothetical protein